MSWSFGSNTLSSSFRKPLPCRWVGVGHLESVTPTASILFRQGSLLLGPVALLSSSRVPTRLMSYSLCGGYPLRSPCCRGPREGSVLVRRPRDAAWCWSRAQGPMRRTVCVRAQARILVPASSPKGKRAPNRARVGGGSLEGFNCWLPYSQFSC